MCCYSTAREQTQSLPLACVVMPQTFSLTATKAAQVLVSQPLSLLPELLTAVHFKGIAEVLDLYSGPKGPMQV